MVKDMKIKKETYNIDILHNGIYSKYGCSRNIDIDEAIDSLMYYDSISNNYDEESLRSLLVAIKDDDYHIFGRGDWTQYQLCKK